jgi:hypothetical protein
MTNDARLPILAESRDRAVALKLVSYSLPLNVVDNDWDANWLVIQVGVIDGERRWTAWHASLLTQDVWNLIDWCRALADGTPSVRPKWSGLQPDLQMEAEPRDGMIAVQVLVWRGLAPPDNPRPPAPVPLQLTVRPEALHHFALNLEIALQDFPIRAIEVNGTAARWISERRTRSP